MDIFWNYTFKANSFIRAKPRIVLSLIMCMMSKLVEKGVMLPEEKWR